MRLTVSDYERKTRNQPATISSFRLSFASPFFCYDHSWLNVFPSKKGDRMIFIYIVTDDMCSYWRKRASCELVFFLYTSQKIAYIEVEISGHRVFGALPTVVFSAAYPSP